MFTSYNFIKSIIDIIKFTTSNVSIEILKLSINSFRK